MSFYQNPFVQEFRGSHCVLGDRQASLSFPCLPNAGRGAEVVQAGNASPYNIAGVDADGGATRNITIHYAMDADLFVNWADLTILIAGAVPAATTAAEIVVLLTADATFDSYFTASEFNGALRITQKNPVNNFRFYIDNGTAETILGFNHRAGVAELPSYYDRHIVENRFTYADSMNQLIRLTQDVRLIDDTNPAQLTSPLHGLTTGDTITIANSNSGVTVDGDHTVTVIDDNIFSVPVNNTGGAGGAEGSYAIWGSRVDVAIIANAVAYNGVELGLTLATAQRDYELLSGRSALFNFRNITVDATDRITQIIEYPAGAVAGDMGIRTINTYTGVLLNPDQTTVEPWVLAAADLVTPPDVPA